MIKQNKLSLTKKLDGGYLHVKKSPNKVHVKKGGYSDYLHKQTAGNKPSANKSSNNKQSNNQKTKKNKPTLQPHRGKRGKSSKNT